MVLQVGAGCKAIASKGVSSTAICRREEGPFTDRGWILETSLCEQDGILGAGGRDTEVKAE
jgi:hypothetical protein